MGDCSSVSICSESSTNDETLALQPMLASSSCHCAGFLAFSRLLEAKEWRSCWCTGGCVLVMSKSAGGCFNELECLVAMLWTGSCSRGPSPADNPPLMLKLGVGGGSS